MKKNNIFGILILLISLFYSCVKEKPTYISDGYIAEESNDTIIHNYGISAIINSDTKCQVMAEDFVRKNLKNPRSADFYGGTVHEPINSNTVKVIGKFSATNSYGGTIENHYRIKMKFLGGEWEDNLNWEVISLEFE